MRLLSLGISIVFICAQAIFEDQIGKFDWRKELMGCPNRIIFDRFDLRSNRFIVSTEESVVASLASDTGETVWRRIMEDSHSASVRITLADNEEFVYTVTSDGRAIRVWRKSDGVLVQQFAINDKQSQNLDILVRDKILFIATEKKVASLSFDNEKVIESHEHSSGKMMSAFFHWKEHSMYVSADYGSTKLDFLHLNGNGKLGKVESFDFTIRDVNKCHKSSYLFTCFEGRTLNTVNVFDSTVVQEDVDFVIESVIGSDEMVIVRGKSKVIIFQLAGQQLHQKVVKEIDSSERFELVKQASVFVLVSNKNIQLISSDNGEVLIESPLPNAVRAPPKFVSARSATKSSVYEIVIVGEDCRVEMISVDILTKQAKIEWVREESLINIESVEMVDLPLSESQQMIEDEFQEEEANVFSALARRIHVQFGQLCRFLTNIFGRLMYVATYVSQHGNGLSDFISTIRSKSNLIDSHALFERDYFNLRKVLIVASIDGTIYGIDSSGGNILWKIWLGRDFSPLETEPDNRRIPLFVQRTTAHYQLHGIATIAFSNKRSGNGVIFSFNPMTGEETSRTVLEYPLKRISLLPVNDHKHVHPVVIIGAKNEIHVSPEIAREQMEACTSLYIMNIDSNTNEAVGLQLNVADKKIDVVWSGNLGLDANDKVLAVRGKPYNQKVHSQGRVLFNRDVQYKYVNPNLAAVASLNKVAQQLTVILVDVVTGQVVHSSFIGKAAEPVHLVHSENWVAYTYWSEKGRRTELGIIELYEGTVNQSQKVVFDSKLLDREPPTVLTQSYIYAQGVDAMSISETEQGLTTRSILLALPSGNIHEVSRRLLDATRPTEVTQAMREEMIIGYMPEIAVGTEEMINYNQTVHRVRGIKTSPSGLESTSLVLAYGTDLFFTRLVPSGTFDILKDDFDHVLISIVLAGLIMGSYVTKKWARSNALAAQWT